MKNDLRVVLTLFFFAFSVYFFFWLALFKSGRNEFLIQSEDAIPSTYLPASVLFDGDFYLDEYYDFFRKNWPDGDDKKAKPYYLAYSHDKRILSSFPVFNALLSMPFYIPLKFFPPQTAFKLIPFFGRISVSFFCSLGAVFIYLISLSFLKDRRKALLIYFSYAFGTINFALLSQSMWQHGFTASLLAGAFYFLSKGDENERGIKYAGLFLSLATLIRPTSIIPAVAFTIYVFMRKRKELSGFILLALSPLPLHFWYAQKYLGGILNHPYKSQLSINFSAPFPQGFLGLWLSPSKGILAYSPIFFFSLFSAFLLFRKKGKTYMFGENRDLLLKISFVVVLLFTLLMGKWVHWYGGWGFGYRMASDVLPLLAVLLLPFFASKYYKRFSFVFVAFFFWSLIIELFGMFFDFRHWHTLYDKGPWDRRWLWSIKDSEMGYYTRRFIAKFSNLKL